METSSFPYYIFRHREKGLRLCWQIATFGLQNVLEKIKIIVLHEKCNYD
jgi:hypothetical protein